MPDVSATLLTPTADVYRTRDPNTLLTRKDCAQALTSAGFPISFATLATKATRGGGPPYRLFGARPLYRWGDALHWAQSRLSPPRRSTSEADASQPPK